MKKDNKVKFILSILVVIIVIMLIFNRFLFGLKDGIDDMALPLQSKIFSISTRIVGIKDSIFSHDNIVEQNLKLKEENMRLKIDEMKNKEVQEENKRLLELLKMKENLYFKDGIKFTRVIFSDADNMNNKVYIDLGIKDGMKVDMVAIYGEYLVGKISKVYRDYSVVDLITNPKSMVSSKTIEDVLGVTRGSDEENGLLYFQASIFDERITVGDEVITSGISNIYPEGLKIGKVLRIDEKENYAYKTIKMEPGFKTKDLRELVIINSVKNLQ